MTKRKILELLSLPITYLALLYLKALRRVSPELLPRTTKLYKKSGIFPLKDHYYEPFPQFNHIRDPERLQGLIDFNIDTQLSLLTSLHHEKEIENLWNSGGNLKIKYKNTNRNFSSGSIDVLYGFIRHFKPSRMIEVGSGHSTIIAANAFADNAKEDSEYEYEHTCIEPYEMDWLIDLPVSLQRKQVQEVDISFFTTLEENDILFIDSSHIIRPGGDVLYEYLNILPVLKKGVIVHIHDIFTPFDYPDKWVKKHLLLWNEQYLLESILIHSQSFKILNSLHYLHTNHFEELSAACPTVKLFPDRKGSSMWLVKE